MARKPNYDFEKRRKEQERKAKKEEKAKRREEAAANRTGEGGEGGEAGDGMDVDGMPAGSGAQDAADGAGDEPGE